MAAIPAVMRPGWSASPEHLRVPGQPKQSTPGVARDRSLQAQKFAPAQASATCGVARLPIFVVTVTRRHRAHTTRHAVQYAILNT